ncbi:ribosome small subunit-dependent GTPase A [Aliikangiella sp. IMCC44359]|uniref:ribosome small subunit-dependent GTPase A n=1 Tax=Aliikangiella sp. IMCC44359 TaxID=3459125 RepID=UPI00403AB295
MTNHLSLTHLGWQPFFQQQVSLEEWDSTQPARIIEQHKFTLTVITEQGEQNLPIKTSMPPLSVGDWVLLDLHNNFVRALERKSCFKRKAPGSQLAEQLIAANIDTAFIVCSLNDDFNLNRLERYLTIVNEAGATPVVVLTKEDICEHSNRLKTQAQQLDPLLCIALVNCLDNNSLKTLLPWCQTGKTIALLGSSGAGKSTLSNGLLGQETQLTGIIREDDDKGRHTTTKRSLLMMPNGAMILDTPGMRELQLSNCEDGIATTFADIETLAKNCRFNDCQHKSEPGCAVIQAIDSQQLEQRRFNNYLKLTKEQAINSASLSEKRANDKKLSQYYHRVQKESKKIKRG